jgi:hypothetical protein
MTWRWNSRSLKKVYKKRNSEISVSQLYLEVCRCPPTDEKMRLIQPRNGQSIEKNALLSIGFS